MNDKYIRLLKTLEKRFKENSSLHKALEWETVIMTLEGNKSALDTILKMEESGGEPDVITFDDSSDIYFIDTSTESPSKRRSLCYDEEALHKRKENKPRSSAMFLAEEIGATLLTKEQYLVLQSYKKVDQKSSSWLLTPLSIRKLGGAIYGESRFNEVFIGANGAESYYSSRGFRLIYKIKG